MNNSDFVKKIAILGTLPPIRGLSSYCYELSNAIADICDIEFISFKKIYPSFLYPGGNLKDDPTFPSISKKRLNVKRRLAWYNPLSWISEGLSTKADILHAQWWSMPLFPIYLFICFFFRLRKIPIILTVHNVLSHEKSFVFDKISLTLFKLSDHFIVHSKASRRQMINYFHVPQDKISVISHGRLDFHVRRDIDRMALRKEFGYSSEDKVILLFGAIRPYKGVDIAIKAFAKIIREIPSARLLIAGKLWEEWKSYQRIIDEFNLNNHVSVYPEYIPSNQVYKFFEAADLAVFPYRHFDSQSGAGATAISFRKPMIVTNVGGLPELVADRRWVIPPDDPEALAKAAVLCLRDPQLLQHMITGVEQISKNLEWSDIARKTMKVYDQVIKQKNFILQR